MPSFDRAVEFTRRPWQRRIEVFSPKLGRRLSLYSRAAHQACLLLESDPAVKRYCERPAFLESNPKVMLDFWVERGRRSEFWLLEWGGERAVAPKTSHGIAIRVLRREELLAQATRIQNWARIHPYLVSEARYLDAGLVRSVLARLAKPHRLQAIETAFNPIDPTTVRAAVFRLLASGKIAAPELDTVALGAGTVFRQASR